MSTTPSHPHCLPRATKPALHYNSPAGRASSTRWFLLNSIPLTSVIGLGALLQYGYTLALAYAPISTGAKLGAWCALPLAMMLGPFVRPTLQNFGLLKNPWMEEVIPGKTYAHLPGGIEDEEGVRQSPEFAVLLIGARCNAPFGPFSGNRFAEIGTGFSQMWRDLEADPNSGLLNAESFLSTSRPRNNNLMTMGTFRSTADVHAAARGPLHRQMMKLYREMREEEAKKYEVWHELYTIKAGGSEGVYLNSTPHGLGGIFAPVGGESVEFEGEGSAGSVLNGKTSAEEGATMYESVLRLAKGRQATSRGRMGMKL